MRGNPDKRFLIALRQMATAQAPAPGSDSLMSLPFQGPHPGLCALSVQHFVRCGHQQPRPALSCRAAPAVRGCGGSDHSQPGESQAPTSQGPLPAFVCLSLSANLCDVGLISPVVGRTRAAQRAETPESPTRPGDPAQDWRFLHWLR